MEELQETGLDYCGLIKQTAPLEYKLVAVNQGVQCSKKYFGELFLSSLSYCNDMLSIGVDRCYFGEIINVHHSCPLPSVTPSSFELKVQSTSA